ncbi:hypothetical protein DFQ27_004385 [Actinomortierella ambigua]|uniref:Uricase n=1 Tax=Actinomortierella ambigua TaxID=1343610 RepID=A0A9P6Q3U4_9FUNG|nr:hypothetical protein DFQ26_003985 [Actinomortierella ambigua]KAG0258917.1 hypothetical protein DFQ27_004385 [Actinomortierella ambigua]
MSANSEVKVYLDKQEYGKKGVRLLKVYRDGNVHYAEEMVVRVLLSGPAFTTSYTEASNKAVVATDSIKNTIYVKAKFSKVVGTIELFAAELGNHFLDQYSWVEAANVSIQRLRWARMIVDGKPHPHSFWRDGTETRDTNVVVRRACPGKRSCFIKSAINDLLVMKTTGSSFEDFVTDEYRTLPDMKDRIMSTSIDCKWDFLLPSNTPENLQIALDQIPFDAIFDSVRQVTCDTFAKDESASVQATLYLMAEQTIKNWKWVEKVSYALPNKHYFPVDLSYFRGTKNLQEHADVYQPIIDPAGYITAVVARSHAGPASKI